MKRTVLVLIIVLYSASLRAGQYENLLGEGTSLRQQGKLGEALGKFREAISIEPKFVTAYYEALNIFNEMKAFDSTIVYAKKIVGIDSLPASVRSAAYMAIGNSYGQKDDFEKSVQAFREGIYADPNSQILHFSLAVAFLRHGDMKEGAGAIRQSLRLDPSHSGSNYYYARLLMNEGRRIQYLFAALAAVALENNSPRAKQEVGNIEYVFETFGKRNGAAKVGKMAANDSLLGSAEAALEALAANGKNAKSNPGGYLQFNKRIECLLGTLPMLEQMDDEFTKTVYLDAFAKLKGENLGVALSRIVYAASGDRESISWCEKNKRKVEACLKIMARERIRHDN